MSHSIPRHKPLPGTATNAPSAAAPGHPDASLTLSALGRGSLVVLLAQGLQSFRGIILLPFITRLLSTGDYGLWVQAGTLTALLGPIATLHLESALLRYFAAEAKPREAARALTGVFFTVAAIAVATTGVAVIASNGIAAAFFTGQRAVALLSLLSLLPEALASMCLAYFRTFRQLGRFACFSVARPYVELMVVATLLCTGHHLWHLLLAIAVVRALLTITMLTLVLHQTGLTTPDLSRLPRYLRFSLPLLPTNMLLWVTNASDRFIIGHYLGPAAVGLYNPGYALGSIAAAISAPVMFVLPPFVYAHYDRGRPHLAMAYLSTTLLLIAVAGLLAAAVLGGLSSPLLSLLSTDEIASSSLLVTPFVALGVTAQTCTVVVSIALGCVKKTHLMACSAAAGAGLNLGLNIIFIPRYGIVAAAITTLLAMLTDLSIRLHLARRELDWLLPAGRIARVAIAAAALGVLLHASTPSAPLELAGLVFAAPILYLLLLLALRVFSAADIVLALRFMAGLLRGRG